MLSVLSDPRGAAEVRFCVFSGVFFGDQIFLFAIRSPCAEAVNALCDPVVLLFNV
jgi:hypothetical protein